MLAEGVRDDGGQAGAGSGNTQGEVNSVSTDNTRGRSEAVTKVRKMRRQNRLWERFRLEEGQRWETARLP